ncbi:helix-turn-helix domain-containing protein [Paenibacillus sp. LMG 31456]|uniref:Helix-turn-helix domain-containing protein n=1 Tax=Paenibacillus foliorum TaxID=2654974 RepID=A0A972JZM3_9BACL|nr:helix-turn-helix domain-containing protein [Paenibacillus foliorum]NOU93756.1 helix-turn-helix domain-containing protein [Paenibacillus foliorum]
MKAFVQVLFNDKFRSLFYRLSAALILLMLLIVVAIYLFSNGYNSLLQKTQLEKLNARTESLFRTYYDSLFQDIDNRTVQLSNNTKLIRAINSIDPESAGALQNILHESTDFCCIQYLEIYTRNGAIRYTHGEIRDIPLLSDAEWQSETDKIKGSSNWEVARTTVDGSIPSIILLRGIPNIAVQPLGVIKVMLNSQSLFINPYHIKGSERMWVVSPNKQLFNLKTGTPDTVPIADKLVPKLKNTFFQGLLDDKSYFFYYSPSGIPGWSYLNAVDSAALSGSLYVRLAIITAFALMFLLLIIYMFLMIRNIFSKLHTIQEVVGADGEEEGRNGSNASLNVLVNSIAALKEHRENIETMYRKNIPILKQALCYRLLHQDQGEWPEIREQMVQIGIKFPTPMFAIMLFRIDRYFDFLQNYSRSDQSLFRFFIYKMAEELGEQSFKVLLWNSESQDIVMLCNSKTPITEEEFKAKLESVTDTILVHVHQYLKITVTAAISRPVLNIKHIPDAWNLVTGCIERKWYNGGTHVLKDWEMTGETPVMFGFLESARKRRAQLLLAVKSGDLQLIHIEMDTMQSFLESLEGYPMMVIQQILNDLFMSVIFTLLEMGVKLQIDSVFTEMHLEMQRRESIRDAIDWFRERLDRWIEGTDKQRTEGTNLIPHILEYIHANYNREISLGGISDELGLDIAYLSRQFKKGTGKNFMDYLINLRIERAKQMLLSLSGTVQQIAENVGYVNSQSFIRIFKKHVGVTPGQYREMQSVEQEKRLDASKLY